MTIRPFPLLLLAALSPAASARPTAAAPAAIPYPDTLVVLLRNPWESLDPAASDELGSLVAIGNIYESLIAFGASPEEFRPWLSREVPSRANGLISPDGKRYAFPLRPGVKFHDGSALAAEDIRYSFVRALLLKKEGKRASLLLRPLLGMDSARDAEGRSAIDPEALRKAIFVQGDQVVFQMRAPFPGFLKLIASCPIVISKAWAVAHGDWDGGIPSKGAQLPAESPFLTDHANGTGPYRVERADLRTTHILLASHESYWRAPPRLRHAFIRSEASDAIRISMLQQGDADYVYLERPHLPLLRGEKGITILDDIPGFSSGETFFFTLEIDAKDNARLGSGRLDGKGIPPGFFEDKDARIGFAYAWDDQTFLKTALAGKGIRASGPIPAALLEKTSASNPFHYDASKAEESLRKAFGGALWERGFRFTLSYPRGSVRRQIACEILKSGLERLNPKFHIDLEAFSPVEFKTQYQLHRLPLFVHSLAAYYPDPHEMAFQFLHSKGYFAKAQRFSDPELDRLEEKAAREPDATKRLELFLQLERTALEKSFQIYAYYPIQFKAVRAWLKGLDRDQTVNGMSFLNLLYFQPLVKE